MVLAALAASGQVAGTGWEDAFRAAVRASEEGAVEEAVALAHTALAEAEKLEPQDERLATTLDLLAGLYLAQGQFDQGQPLFLRSLDIWEQVLGTTSHEYFALRRQRVQIFRLHGQAKTAELLFVSGLEKARAQFGREHWVVAAILIDLGNFYTEEERYDEAERITREALALRVKLFGPEHPDIATALYNLGIVYGKQSRLREAQDVYQQALAMQENTSGSEDVSVAPIATNLAGVYRQLGKLQETRALQERALTLWERAAAPDGLIAFALFNLGDTLAELRESEKAETVLERSLRIRESLYGATAPALVEVLNALGFVLTQRDPQRADTLLERARAILENSETEDKSLLSYVLANLAVVRRDQGRLEEAEGLLRQALTLREARREKEPLEVAYLLKHLALFYDTTERYKLAESFYRRALDLFEKHLDPDHPERPRHLNDVATFLAARGQHAEADALYQRAVAEGERILGPTHPTVLAILQNYANLLHWANRHGEADQVLARVRQAERAQVEIAASREERLAALLVAANRATFEGQSGEAEKFYREALQLAESIKPGHPEIPRLQAELLSSLMAQGKHEEASALLRLLLEARPAELDLAGAIQGFIDATWQSLPPAEVAYWYEQLVAGQEERLGLDDPGLVPALVQLAEAHRNNGELTGAETALKRALAIREARRGPEHIQVLDLLRSLGALYSQSGRSADAEPVYRRILASQESLYGTNHPALVGPLYDLARVLRELGRVEEAQQLETRAHDLKSATKKKK